MKLTILTALVCLLSTVSVFALDPHVEAVIRAVEGAKGKVEKTEDGQSLKLFDLAVPGAGPHDHLKDDPYDAAFFEHLGHISTLESLNVISTKANDDWIKPLGKLTKLKTLRFTNNGKLTDAGMETFAGLRNLESFSFVGTQITGRAYAKCSGWSKVTRVSHRGSKIDDEGCRNSASTCQTSKVSASPTRTSRMPARRTWPNSTSSKDSNSVRRRPRPRA